MPGAALRGARGTLRVHPARRPISALPAPLLANRITTCALRWRARRVQEGTYCVLLAP
jgi:hypothetical protein